VTCGAAFRGFAGVYGSLHDIVVVYSADCCESVALLCSRIIADSCKFIGTKGSVYIRKEFNSHRIGLVHQDGCHFIVLGRQYRFGDVMQKYSIVAKENFSFKFIIVDSITLFTIRLLKFKCEKSFVTIDRLNCLD